MIYNEDYDKLNRAERALGKHLKINGKWVLDTSMGAGTHLFGHGTFIKNASKSLKNGTLFIVPNKLAEEVSELLRETTKFKSFVFCNTGSEATMRCIRIARAYTGRDKIAFFEGYWHGTHDWSLTTYSKGIPQAVKDLVTILPFNDESFNVIEKRDIAIAMIEPIQSSLPINRQEFLNKLKNVCNKTGTVLCFDEVKSGFRSSLGGASEFLGIKPDLAAFGKIVGGGFPIGIIGGDSIMEIIKTGVRMGGTFSANPLSMTVAKDVLKKLIKENIYKKLNSVSAELYTLGHNYQILSLGNLAKIIFTKKLITSCKERDTLEISKELQLEIRNKALSKGIYINSSNAMELSILHTLEDVQLIKEVVCEITKP